MSRYTKGKRYINSLRRLIPSLWYNMACRIVWSTNWNCSMSFIGSLPPTGLQIICSIIKYAPQYRGILFAIPEHSFASTLRAVAKLQFARTRVITLHAHSVVVHTHQLYVYLWDTAVVIITGYYMGYTLIWVLSTSDTYHITNEWAQRTSEWCDMCHELIKSISKCNPCYNLFITYHIQGIVRMYQWVRNAILACLMITYDTVNGLFCAMHVTPRILFTLRLRCFLNILCKRISRKRIIVYRKYVMFIKHAFYNGHKEWH